jgi:hypothetical protein
MPGYRAQIRRACLKAGRHGGTFDCRDIMLLLPTGASGPTLQEVVQVLRLMPEIEVERQGDNHRPTEYRLRREPWGEDDGE